MTELLKSQQKLGDLAEPGHRREHLRARQARGAAVRRKTQGSDPAYSQRALVLRPWREAAAYSRWSLGPGSAQGPPGMLPVFPALGSFLAEAKASLGASGPKVASSAHRDPIWAFIGVF